MTGWEHPEQDGKPDADRIFEALWSVDPAVVRSATMIAAGLAAAASPGRFSPLQARVAEPAAPVPLTCIGPAACWNALSTT